jgi:hypothetical protein
MQREKMTFGVRRFDLQRVERVGGWTLPALRDRFHVAR